MDERFKCFFKNLPLNTGMLRRSGGMPQGVIQKDGPGGINGFGNIDGTAHAKRGNSGGLGAPGNQSHGLMAHRSDRYQENGIDLFGQQPFR